MKCVTTRGVMVKKTKKTKTVNSVVKLKSTMTTRVTVILKIFVYLQKIRSGIVASWMY